MFYRIYPYELPAEWVDRSRDGAEWSIDHEAGSEWQLIKLIDSFDPHGIGKYRTCNFAVSFLSSRTWSQFCLPGFVYFSPSANQQCNSRRDWRKLFKNSLRTEKKRFFRIAPLDLCRTHDWLLFLSTLDYHNKKMQTDMHFVHPVHTFQTFLCLVVQITNRLDKDC